MVALIIGAIVTVIAAFGAAYYGARLQRKWTPNPIPAIEKVETRVAELRKRVDEIEQERTEREAFTLGIQLRQAIVGEWIVEVKNDTDKDVYVETIQFFSGDHTPLSGLDKAKKPDDWRISARSQRQLSWTPQHNPVMTLKSAGIEPHGFGRQYRLVLESRIDGKPRITKRDLLLTYRDNTLTQYGP